MHINRGAAAMTQPRMTPFVKCCREGDLVTVTSRQDLQRAMQEAISASQSSPHGPRLSNTLPPIRLQLVPVASEVGSSGFTVLRPLACDCQRTTCQCTAVHLCAAKAEAAPRRRRLRTMTGGQGILACTCAFDMTPALADISA